MKNVSIFKKVKLFNYYKKIINSKSEELELKYNIRIDYAKRMYTVLNVPKDLVGEAYSLKKQDIDRISESYIKQYTSDLNDYLNSIGLNELHDFYHMKKVDKYSYLLVFGYSLFKSQSYYNYIYYGLFPVSIIGTFLLIYTFL